MARQSVTVYLPGNHPEFLDRISQRLQISKNQVFHKMFNEFVDKHPELIVDKQAITDDVLEVITCMGIFEHPDMTDDCKEDLLEKLKLLSDSPQSDAV